MRFSENLYKAFLEVMQDLENFRMTYAAVHPTSSLDSDDPDVKRLIEAMAFFSARTHTAGIRHIVAARRRLFRQFFPYLLSPLPAMGILQVQPTGRFVDSIFLPKNSEIAVSTESEGPAIFRTLCALNILPITVRSLNMAPLPGSGYRVAIRISAPFPVTEKIERLSFYINHLNDYHASMRVFFSLKRSLKKAAVVFDDTTDAAAKARACSTRFGIPYSHADIAIQHPLQQERLFFHFPQQELFLEIGMGASPREWRQFTLLLDLDDKWPKNLHLNREIFQLFSTPIMNLQHAMAQPFICDGTKERYPIRHMEPEKGFEFHSVLGVYKNEKTGTEPIGPGILSGDQVSYEIEQDVTRDGKNQYWLDLHFPQAFDTPKTILLDALWLQPWLSSVMRQKLEIAPYNKSIAGLKWGLCGDLVPHAENTFQDETEGFMHLLTLKNKSMLNIDETVGILRILGSVHRGRFKGIIDLLTDIQATEKPLQSKTAGGGLLKLVYILKFAGLNPAVLPLIETFARHVGRILDLWISAAKVEVKVEITGQAAGRTAAGGRQ